MAVTNSWTLPAAPAPSPPPATTVSPLWTTVEKIISDVAQEEGIAPEGKPVTDPYGSLDANILQLTALLKSAGRALVRERGWTHLQREYTAQTVAGQAAYALPSDFREMVDQSGWNRTTRYMLGGPIGGEAWQYAKAITIAGAIQPWVRFQGGQFSFTPTPVAVETVAFEYRSWSWIMPAGETEPTMDAPTAATDIVCFNSALMVCALKLAWEKAKRMDTTSAQADYDRALAAAMNEDSQSPEIYLGSSEGSPAQDVWGNVPQTGIGQ